MKTIKRTAAALLAGVACMLLSVAASASPITLTNQTFSDGSVDIALAGPRAVTARTGEFRFTVLATGETLDAFCIDVTNNLVTPASYDVIPAGGNLTDQQVNLLGRLYDNHYASINGAVESAAFQLAVWEIIYDPGTLDLSTGFRVTSSSGNALAAKTTAQGWLSSLSSLSGGPSLLYEFDILRPREPLPNQALLTARRVNVPEPGSLLLLGLGVLGAGATRRFRKH